MYGSGHTWAVPTTKLSPFFKAQVFTKKPKMKIDLLPFFTNYEKPSLKKGTYELMHENETWTETHAYSAIFSHHKFNQVFFFNRLLVNFYRLLWFLDMYTKI